MFALLLAAGCSGEPTESFREGVNLRAEPSQVFLEVGATTTVQVYATDNQGNPLSFDYEVTQEGSGIDVRRDSTFQPIYVDDSTLAPPAVADRFQFIVEGGAYTSTSFTVTAGGEELVIPVQVIPQDAITATISNVNPGFGEEVTITAPAGTHFTAESQVTLPGALVQPLTVSVSPDGTTLVAIFPPNVASAPVITNVTSDGAPTLVFNPATSEIITSPVVDSVSVTLSSATPDAGADVTVTSTDPNFTFDENTSVTVSGTPGFLTSVAPDGSSFNFVLAPGVTGPVIINGVIVGGFGIPLPAKATTITSGPTVTPLAGTDDPATAPTIRTPAEGVITGIVDNPSSPGFGDCGVGVPCTVYQFVVPADGAYDFTATWEGTSDVGVYFFEADGVTEAGNSDCDSLGNEGGQPEVCTEELVAGTYIVAVAPFGPFYDPAEANPNWVQIAVTPHVE